MGITDLFTCSVFLARSRAGSGGSPNTRIIRRFLATFEVNCMELLDQLVGTGVLPFLTVPAVLAIVAVGL